MDPARAITEAINFGKQAAEQDLLKNYKDALNLYANGVNCFLDGLKNGNLGDIAKNSIKLRCNKFLERIDKIKQILSERVEPQNPVEYQDVNVKVQGILNGLIDTSKSDIEWSSVVGLEGAKECLRQAIILPAKYHDKYEGNEFPWNGILFYGPPGTGKTYLAKAVANRISKYNSNHFAVSSSSLTSKYLEEPAKLMAELFKLARSNKPSVIFFDDLDVLCSEDYNERTEKMLKEFLDQMAPRHDNDGIIVLGSTNKPWKLHSSIRKRFEKQIYIPLPEQCSRFSLFKVYLGKVLHTLSEQDFNLMAKKSAGYSGADILCVVRDAISQTVRLVQKATHFKKVSGPSPIDASKVLDDLLTPCEPDYPGAIVDNWENIPNEKIVTPPVTLEMLLSSLESNKPSVDHKTIENLEKFAEEFAHEFAHDGLVFEPTVGR